MRILFNIIYLFALALFFSTGSLYSLSYDSEIKARLSTTSLEKSVILDGYSMSQLEINDILFSADIFIDDNEYLYNLSSDNKLKIFANLYTGYSFENSDLYFGYMPNISDSYFYNKILNRHPSYFGVKELKRFDADKVDNINNIANNENYYVYSSAYSKNNSGLSTAYIANFLDERLYLGVSYTNNMNVSLRNYSTQNINLYKDPLDITAIFYDEYLDIGYGAHISSRKYLDASISDFPEEFGIGFVVDFFGLSYQGSYLKGTNAINDGSISDLKYTSLENEFYYNFFSFTAGVYTLSSIVSGHDFKHKINLTELNLKYQISRYFYVSGSVFYQNTFMKGVSNLSKNAGILAGLVIEY